MVALLLAGVVAYAAQYLIRGLLGGLRWFNGYATCLVADGAARVVWSVPLVFVASRGVAGAALVAAAVGGALVPVLYRRRRLAALGHDGPGEPFQLRAALRFAAPAGVVAGADQLLVNGGPLLVILAYGQGARQGGGHRLRRDHAGAGPGVRVPGHGHVAPRQHHPPRGDGRHRRPAPRARAGGHAAARPRVRDRGRDRRHRPRHPQPAVRRRVPGHPHGARAARRGRGCLPRGRDLLAGPAGARPRRQGGGRLVDHGARLRRWRTRSTTASP